MLFMEEGRVLLSFLELLPLVVSVGFKMTKYIDVKRVIWLEEIKQGLAKAVRVMKIEVDTGEQVKLAGELDQFLQWLKPLLELQTEGVDQVLVAHDKINVMRKDKAVQGELAELQEAPPDFAGGFYQVPPIIE